jgi:hypothetical protein
VRASGSRGEVTKAHLQENALLHQLLPLRHQYRNPLVNQRRKVEGSNRTTAEPARRAGVQRGGQAGERLGAGGVLWGRVCASCVGAVEQNVLCECDP